MNVTPTTLCPGCGALTPLVSTPSGELAIASHRDENETGRRSHCADSGAVVEPLLT